MNKFEQIVKSLEGKTIDRVEVTGSAVRFHTDDHECVQIRLDMEDHEMVASKPMFDPSVISVSWSRRRSEVHVFYQDTIIFSLVGDDYFKIPESVIIDDNDEYMFDWILEEYSQEISDMMDSMDNPAHGKLGEVE